MRLLYDNLIDYAGVGLTYASQNASLPATNVINQQRKKVYRTGSTIAAEYLQFDFGAAKTVAALIVLDHTLQSGDTLLIQANATSSFGSPAFSQAVTWNAGPISHIFAAQSYRYWRFAFTKPSAGVTRDIGRLFLGSYYQAAAADAPDYDGLDLDREDLSVIQRSVSGVVYGDIRPQFRVPMLKFSAISKAHKEALEAVAAKTGKHTSFFLQIDENASAGVEKEIIYVNLRRVPRFEVSTFDEELKWDTRLEMEEQL